MHTVEAEGGAEGVECIAEIGEGETLRRTPNGEKWRIGIPIREPDRVRLALEIRIIRVDHRIQGRLLLRIVDEEIPEERIQRVHPWETRNLCGLCSGPDLGEQERKRDERCRADAVRIDDDWLSGHHVDGGLSHQ